jgi:hypothetical protein
MFANSHVGKKKCSAFSMDLKQAEHNSFFTFVDSSRDTMLHLAAKLIGPLLQIILFFYIVYEINPNYVYKFIVNLTIFNQTII